MDWVFFCSLRRKELGRPMVNNHSPPNQRHTIDRMRYEYDDERKLNASHYFQACPLYCHLLLSVRKAC